MEKKNSFVPDNQKIKELESDYLNLRIDGCHKGSKTEKELVIAIQKCAKKFIYYQRERYGFYISPEDVEIKSLEVVEYIFAQYEKRPDFILKKPSGYIGLRVLAALFRHKKIDEYIRYSDKEY